jgi:hypothetical protein
MTLIHNLRGLLAFAVLAVATMTSANAFAQASATGQANANATIAKPITITKTADLNFGTIVPNSAGNLTVTIDTAGALTMGGVSDGAHLGGTTGAAAFDVTGRPNAAYSITLPNSVTLTGLTDNTQSLTADAFKDTKGGDTTVPTTGTSSLSAGPGTGTDNFSVGGTLTVPAGTVAQDYQGTLSVTVAYN